MGSLGRIVQHPFATVMTMAVIGIAHRAAAVPECAAAKRAPATADWNQAFDLSVYLDKKAGIARAQALAEASCGRGDVAAVRIITAEQALAEFREYSGFGKALDALTTIPCRIRWWSPRRSAASTPQGTESLKNAIAALPMSRRCSSTPNG